MMKASVVRLLVVALVALAVVGVVADVEIDSMSCSLNSAGYCVSGATISITGNNLDDLEGIYIGATQDVQKRIKCAFQSSSSHSRSCLLTMDYFAGVYAFTGYEDDDDEDLHPMGSLALGELNEFDMSGFSNAWADVTPPPGQVVTGFSSATLISEASWAIYGNFSSASTYKVLFYSDEDMGVPTCGGGAALTPGTFMTQDDSGYANVINCTLKSDPGTMGMFTVLVQEVATKAYLPGSSGLSTVTVQPALPTVSSAAGNCAQDSSACVAGTTLTFTGTNFNPKGSQYNKIVIVNSPEVSTTSGITCDVISAEGTSLTCTLGVADATKVVNGSFGVYAQVALCTHSMWSEQKYLGNLMYGVYNLQNVPGFTANGVDVVASGQVVLGKSDGSINTGGWLAVYGTFAKTHDFTVEFYNTQAAGTGVPTCTSVVVTAYMINCTGVAQALGNLGMYRVLVKDNTAGYYLPTVTTASTSIMVYAPLPNVTAASGSCAAASSSCKTGATLTLTGSNFVVGKTNEVLFTQSGLSCAVATVTTSSSLTCTLTVSSVSTGVYPMYVRSQACAEGMMTPNQAAGYIHIGHGSQQKGWTLSSSSSSSGSSSNDDDDDDDDDDMHGGGNPAAIAFACIFGIVTLGFIIASIVMCCCCTVTRKRKVGANYNPDTMSDRYWNADRAMEMNEQQGGGGAGAPPQAFTTTAVGMSGAPVPLAAGAAGAGMTMTTSDEPTAKTAAPMPPATQVRELERPPAATSQDYSKMDEVNKKYNQLD